MVFHTLGIHIGAVPNKKENLIVLGSGGGGNYLRKFYSCFK